MTNREAAILNFTNRLNNELRKEFKDNTLFVEGRNLSWENLNGTHEIEIISFDGITVEFLVLGEKKIHKFTLDNFFIFDKEYLANLYDNAKEYDSEQNDLKDYSELNERGIYIYHDKSKDDTSGYYVGQAEHLLWRIKDHNQSSELEIEKLINSKMKYTLRFIPLKDSTFDNLDALEAAFIAYFDSFHKHKGYNHTRGNNGPGNKEITVALLDE